MIQIKSKEGGLVYRPGRDIVHWFVPCMRAVTTVMVETLPVELHDDVAKLIHAVSDQINESLTGAEKLEMEEILALLKKCQYDSDPRVAALFNELLVNSVFWRYICGCREQVGNELHVADIEKSFTGMYLLQLLPPDLALACKSHLRAYKHLPEMLFENEVPTVEVEVPDEEVENDE